MTKDSTKLRSARKIAVVRTDKLGDMVLTLPLVKALKIRFPNAEMVVIANSYVSPLLEDCPVIDEALYFDKIPGGIRGTFENGSFDAAFFPRPRYEEAKAAFLARVPLRVGSAYRAYSILFNHRVKDHRKAAEHHEAEYNTRMLGSVLGEGVETELVAPVISPEVSETAEKLLGENGINRKFIIIHPGSGGSAYDWSAENFGKLAREIFEGFSLPVVITGSAGEAEKCKSVEEQCPGAISLCGKTNLPELMGVVSRASLLAANSTGVLHIAAAMGVPVLGFYPNTAHIGPGRWGPYSIKAAVITPPIGGKEEEKDDMNLITVAKALEAAETLISRYVIGLGE